MTEVTHPFPYEVTVSWSGEDECYLARIQRVEFNFAGCSSHGDTMEEAVANVMAASSSMKSVLDEDSETVKEVDTTVEAIDITDPKKPRRVKLPEKLRYMSPENIAKDFPLKRERAAIRAVFSWLSLSGSCGRKLKRRGHVKVGCSAGEFVREMAKEHDVVVWDVSTIERAAKILKTGGPWEK